MSVIDMNEYLSDLRNEEIRREEWAKDDERLARELDEIMRQIEYDANTDRLLAIVCIIVVVIITWGLA